MNQSNDTIQKAYELIIQAKYHFDRALRDPTTNFAYKSEIEMHVMPQINIILQGKRKFFDSFQADFDPKQSPKTEKRKTDSSHIEGRDIKRVVNRAGKVLLIDSDGYDQFGEEYIYMEGDIIKQDMRRH